MRHHRADCSSGQASGPRPDKQPHVRYNLRKQERHLGERDLLISIFVVVALLVALVALPVAAQGTRRSAFIVWGAIGLICLVGIILAIRLATGSSPFFFG